MLLDPKALTVWLILSGRAEEALELLAKYYNVSVPRIEVGLPKHYRRSISGCYTAKNMTIFVLNSDTLRNPLVVLHEFYHHLRTSVDKKHKGTEKHANHFAKEFIDAYRVHSVP